jgi:hypothetical protein
VKNDRATGKVNRVKNPLPMKSLPSVLCRVLHSAKPLPSAKIAKNAIPVVHICDIITFLKAGTCLARSLALLNHHTVY